MSDGTVSKAQFADILGCSRGYVSQLVSAGRLVLSQDGKRVVVEASLDLLGVTADPTKAGVRQRWAAHREGKALTSAAASAAPAAEAPPAPAAAAVPPPAEPPAPPSLTPEQLAARELQARRAAVRLDIDDVDKQLKQLELLDRLKKVAEVDPMLRAVVDSHTAIRNELLAMPDRLTQLVAPLSDPRQVYAVIEAECQQTVDRMRQQLLRLQADYQVEALTA